MEEQSLPPSRLLRTPSAVTKTASLSSAFRPATLSSQMQNLQLSATREPSLAPSAPREPSLASSAPREPSLAPSAPRESPLASSAPREPSLAPSAHREPSLAPSAPAIAARAPSIAPSTPAIAARAPSIAPVAPSLAPREPSIAPVAPSLAPREPSLAPVARSRSRVDEQASMIARNVSRSSAPAAVVTPTEAVGKPSAREERAARFCHLLAARSAALVVHLRETMRASLQSRFPAAEVVARLTPSTLELIDYLLSDESGAAGELDKYTRSFMCPSGVSELEPGYRDFVLHEQRGVTSEADIVSVMVQKVLRDVMFAVHMNDGLLIGQLSDSNSQLLVNSVASSLRTCIHGAPGSGRSSVQPFEPSLVRSRVDGGDTISRPGPPASFVSRR